MSMESHNSLSPDSQVYKKKKKKRNGHEESRKKKSKHVESEKSPPAKKQRPNSQPQSSQKNSPVLDTPFYEETSSLYLPLSPISYNHPLSGICAEHLSPLLLTYFPPFQGVILSYSNVQLSACPSETSKSKHSEPILAKSIDEYAVSFVWVMADFIIFRPRRHDLLEGRINLQNEGNLGLLCLNFFNVSIERRRLPAQWVWVPGGRTLPEPKINGEVGRGERPDTDNAEGKVRNMEVDAEEGYFEDGHGKKIEGLVRFRVKNVETSRGVDRENGFMSIEGTMLDEMEEHELHVQVINKNQKKKATDHPSSPSELNPMMSGAILNSSDTDDSS